MPQDLPNTARARAYVEASSAHDVKAIRPMLHETVVYESDNVGRFEGREAALEMMAGFFESFPDVQWAVERYRDRDGAAVDFEFELSATNAKSGERIQREGLERIEFDEQGLITRIVVGAR